MTFTRLVLRALAAGLLAGVVVALYLFTVVEPTIDQAVAGEAAAEVHADADHGHADEVVEEAHEELFSRSTQKAGGMVATVLYATILAGIFGTVFGFVRHWLPGRSDVARVGVLATVAFGSVVVVPALKYPANPPGVGDPDTIDQRTLQYLSLLAISVIVAIVLFWIAAWLRDRVAPSARPALVVVATVVLYGLVLAVVPASPDVVGADLPAQLLWDFRLRSIGGLALLWVSIGAAFGWLLDRESEREAAEAAEAAEAEPTRSLA